MNPESVLAQNMNRSYAPYKKRVSNQRSMAAPRDRLCTHDCRVLPFRKLNQLLDIVVELCCLYIVGKTSK